MRIATWNINGLRARKEFVEVWLKERQPDLVGFQELKMQDVDFPHEFFEELGYEAFVHGQKSWNGVAILSKAGGKLIQKGLKGQDDFGARLITVQVNDLEFTTCYCPNGKDIDHPDFIGKLGWYDSLISESKKSEQKNRILCGDFNIVARPIDSWKGEKATGEIFHTQEERLRMKELKSTGIEDIYESKYKDEQMFTWWDYRGGSFHRKHGLRIDTILATKDIAKRTKDLVIDRDFRKKKGDLTPSDHAPVYIDLE